MFPVSFTVFWTVSGEFQGSMAMKGWRHNWVCVSDRHSARSEYTGPAPVCPFCRAPMVMAFHGVPRKSDDRGWAKLMKPKPAMTPTQFRDRYILPTVPQAQQRRPGWRFWKHRHESLLGPW